jgi:hypothetical protein
LDEHGRARATTEHVSSGEDDGHAGIPRPVYRPRRRVCAPREGAGTSGGAAHTAEADGVCGHPARGRARSPTRHDRAARTMARA